MTKPTLVLLHGVGLDHRMWERVSDLVADRYDVIAPDLPGHGARPPAHEGITLADLAAGVAEEIPAGAHVVGFSLGALVAQHLALHRPGLVGSLVAASSVCRRTPEEREAVLGRLRAAETDFAASVEASIRRWYDDTGVDQDWVDRTRATLLANDLGSFLACYRVFATGDAEVAGDLGRITVPALAVTGELDPGSTPEMSRRFADAVPGGQVVVVPGARHMLPVQDPQAFADAVVTFTEREAHV